MRTFDELKAEAIPFKENKDCGVKAVAVAFGISYADAHAAMELAGRKHRESSYPEFYHTAAKLFDKKLVAVGKKFYAKTIKTLERELPKNRRYIVMVANHSVGAADGKIIDWSKGRCHRIQCILEVKDVKPKKTR